MSSAAEQVKGMAQGATDAVKNTLGMGGAEDKTTTTTRTTTTEWLWLIVGCVCFSFVFVVK